MAAAERDARDSGSSKRERFGGEIAECEGAVAVGNLVLANLVLVVAAGGVQAAAERGPAGDSGVGSGFGGVKNGVGLGVAFAARGALEPNDVASGV